MRVIAAVPPEDPAQREPNTLYSYAAAGEQRVPSPLAVAIYRVYVEDAGYDISGGVGLPQLAVPLPDGRVLRGSEACSALEQLPPVPAAEALNGLDPAVETQPNFAASMDLRWLKFFDLVSSQSHRFDAVPVLGPLLNTALGQSTANSGGFASNVHNSYATASLSQTLGEVGVIEGRFPTTPRTRDGNPVMGDGQLRYWSLCTNEVNSQRYIDCLYDEQVQRLRGDRAIIVVSREQDRPANAIAECGVNWLNWGPFTNSLLIYRHMLPRADFAQAIQQVEVDVVLEAVGAVIALLEADAVSHPERGDARCHWGRQIGQGQRRRFDVARPTPTQRSRDREPQLQQCGAQPLRQAHWRQVFR